MRRFLILAALAILLPGVALAQTSGLSTRAIKQFDAAMTASGYFGVPRYATASLPSCGTGNRGAVAFDTTALTLKVCDGTTWGASGVSVSGTNTWTGTQNFVDANFFWVDDGDATKKVQVQVSGVTTGNTVVPFGFSGTSAAPQVTWANGAAATPTIRFTSDQTGFWQRAANVMDVSMNGVHLFELSSNAAISGGGMIVGSAQSVGWTSATAPAGAPDALIKRGGAAATVQMGLDVNGAPVDQTLRGHNGITGSNIASPRFNLGGQVGTGTGVPGGVALRRALVTGSGTGAQAAADGIVVCGTKTLSNTSATTTALATVGLASNTAGAVQITVSVQCNDGTNFDSDVVTSYVAYVNKAGTITVGAAVTTGSAAANNSGSCTVAPTFTSGASLINVNVTPVITTITPTTTTAFLQVHNFGAGAVACQ